MIDVLLVDDSPTSMVLMQGLLESDPGLQVVAKARSGAEAIRLVDRQSPHVIVMDINMPGLDGYETTQMLMEKHAIPIIICSGAWGSPEAVQSFKAIGVGAVTALAKPQGPGHPDFNRTKADFIRNVKAMSEVRVVRRPRKKTDALSVTEVPPVARLTETREVSRSVDDYRNNVDVVVIGASTGGPLAIKTLLSGVKRDFPFPIVIVQHIAVGFLEGMVNWLGMELDIPFSVAENNQRLLPGTVYFGPDREHIGIKGGRAILDGFRPPEHGLRPSVSYLFRSVAKNHGKRAVGILLTGMGTDGASDLKRMRDSGALTFAQDRKSSLIFGMPGEAVKLKAARHVLSPEEIAVFLNKLS